MTAHIRTTHFFLLALAACEPSGGDGAGTASPDTTGAPSTGEAPPTPTTPSPTTTFSGDEPTGTTFAAPGTFGIDPPPFCGDGALDLDLDEECDLGAANADDGSCTLACKNATCGDGLVWTGVEACDMGPANSPDYGGCAPDCHFAARCGDGTLDVDHEQCDEGSLNGTGMSDGESAPCTKTCRWFGRVVFLSSTTYDGAIYGLPWADFECQNLALWSGLEHPEHYRAWLSDGVYSPNTRFEHTEDGIPYILLNGRIFAGDYVELVTEGPRTGLAITEDGDMLAGARAWTNTDPGGFLRSVVNHCAGWTLADAQFVAQTGLNAVAVEDGPIWDDWKDWHRWTAHADQNCQTEAHLYCFADGPADGP